MKNKASTTTQKYSETEIVEGFRPLFLNNPAVKLGPGDDAAILDGPRLFAFDDMVISVDMLTEGVDFLLDRVCPVMIARKAIAVNLSDLAAMAAEPVACVIAVTLPEKPCYFPGGFDEAGNLVRFLRRREEKHLACDAAGLVRLLGEGFSKISAETGLAIVGGDTNIWAQSLVLSVTVVGKTQNKSPETHRGGPLCRAGARPGDKILVTGPLGGSILRRQFTFTPRVREMLEMNRRYSLHAGMDISDGLTLDLWRLLQESGCGAILDLSRVPIHEDARTLSRLDVTESHDYDWIPAEFAAKTPLCHALTDGEDFEILFTASPETAHKILDEKPLGLSISCIGEIVTEKGLWTQTPTGERETLSPDGFLHGTTS